MVKFRDAFYSVIIFQNCFYCRLGGVGIGPWNPEAMHPVLVVHITYHYFNHNSDVKSHRIIAHMCLYATCTYVGQHGQGEVFVSWLFYHLTIHVFSVLG